jgi:hypothetical protein
MRRNGPRRRRPIARRRRKPSRTWWLDGPMGVKGAPRMSRLGESSAPKPLALQALTRCSSFVFYICVINFCWIPSMAGLASGGSGRAAHRGFDPWDPP